MIRRRKKLLITLSSLFFVSVISHACMTFRMTPKEVDSYFNKKQIIAEQLCYKNGYREIHYVQAGKENNPLIFFIHGSPGSLSAFIHFLTDSILLQHYRLVTTDRPGFGYSNFGNAEPSIYKQADLLIPIVEKFKDHSRPIILVGHSLAAPLIAQMAVNRPELIDGLIMVAGSIDPDLEPNEAWFRIPLSTPFLSWLLPRSMKASNTELYNFKSELNGMMPLWENIRVPVIFIQGGKDVLVDYRNADFAKKMIVNAPVEIIFKEDMNHFVPWSNPELISDAIFRMDKLIKQSVIVKSPEE